MEDFLGLQLSKQRSSARQMCISSPRSFLITFPASVSFLLTINYHFYHFPFFFSTFMVSFFVYSLFQLSLFTYLLFSHLDLPPSLFTGLIQGPSLFCICGQPSQMWGFDCSSAYSKTEHHFMEKRSFQASPTLPSNDVVYCIFCLVLSHVAEIVKSCVLKDAYFLLKVIRCVKKEKKIVKHLIKWWEQILFSNY